MLIKKDSNEQLEKVLARKQIDEQAKNILQGILYKIEGAYKDYKIVKSKKQTEQKYVAELIENIDKKCTTIKTVKTSEKLEDIKIQKELEKNKFYVGEEIISYPIEEKILYAIEKKSRNPQILNNKYEEAAIAISNLINEGKNMDRIEVLRDFNGWSWTTISKEIQNIEANLIYQLLQIILGEEFLNNWCNDKDGIIDYMEEFEIQMSQKYGEKIAKSQKNLLIKIAIPNLINKNEEFAQNIESQIKKINEELTSYGNTTQKIIEITNRKKQLLQELNEIEKVLGQSAKLKDEYEKRNQEATISQKIFNIKVLKKQLENKKNQLLEEISQCNYLMKPANYHEEKNKLINQKENLEKMQLSQEQTEILLIEFIKNFLKCFEIIIQKTKDEEEIFHLIYKLRYFMLLPFNTEKNVKDIEEISAYINEVEKNLVQKAVEKKVIANVPLEIMNHVFRTRIIKLEDLYYKITSKNEKYYVQIFDENISEEKFEITSVEKMKKNKKIQIFI